MSKTVLLGALIAASGFATYSPASHAVEQTTAQNSKATSDKGNNLLAVAEMKDVKSSSNSGANPGTRSGVKASATRKPAAREESVRETASKAPILASMKLLSSQTAKAQSNEESRVRDLVCSLSSFFSIDAEGLFQARTQVTGRGLVSCRNDQGFQSDFPIVATLDAELPVHLIKRKTEITFSGNSSPFIIGQQPNELEDEYSVRTVSWLGSESSEPKILFQGNRHNLTMEIKLNSQTAALNGVTVKSLRLHFDDDAPDLF